MPEADSGRAATELITLAGRVADRLAVVGPRMAARSGAQAAAVLDDVRAVLQRLADLGADAERRPRRPVPVLGAHALGDQVLVLAHDVVACGDEAAQSRALAVLAELAGRI